MTAARIAAAADALIRTRRLSGSPIERALRELAAGRPLPDDAMSAVEAEVPSYTVDAARALFVAATDPDGLVDPHDPRTNLRRAEDAVACQCHRVIGGRSYPPSWGPDDFRKKYGPDWRQYI